MQQRVGSSRRPFMRVAPLLELLAVAAGLPVGVGAVTWRLPSLAGVAVAVKDVQPSAVDTYRPWETRFEPKRRDYTSPDFLRPENRFSYREFVVTHPDHALTPNSEDRSAECTVIVVFSLAVLCTICVTVLASSLLQTFARTDDYDQTTYRKKMLALVAGGSLPWMFLEIWFLSIVHRFFFHPTRLFVGYDTWHLRCDLMVWYLILDPIVNFAYFVVGALWVCKVLFGVERKSLKANSYDKVNEHDPNLKNTLNGIFKYMTKSYVTYTLLVLELLFALFGVILYNFEGPGGRFCDPQLFWVTTALTMMEIILVVFSALAFLGCICVIAIARSHWVGDFVSSFRAGWRHPDAEHPPAGGPPLPPTSQEVGEEERRRLAELQAEEEAHHAKMHHMLKELHSQSEEADLLWEAWDLEEAAKYDHIAAEDESSEAKLEQVWQTVEEAENELLGRQHSSSLSDIAWFQQVAIAQRQHLEVFAVGERVFARHQDVHGNLGEEWLPGRILAKNDSGTYWIEYDVGVQWHAVPPEFIRHQACGPLGVNPAPIRVQLSGRMPGSVGDVRNSEWFDSVVLAQSRQHGATASLTVCSPTLERYTTVVERVRSPAGSFTAPPLVDCGPRNTTGIGPFSGSEEPTSSCSPRPGWPSAGFAAPFASPPK